MRFAITLVVLPDLMVWHADEEEDVDILTLDPTLMQEEDPDSLRYLPVHILPHSPPEALDPDKGGTCPSYLFHIWGLFHKSSTRETIRKWCLHCTTRHA